jgi:DNA polymerase-4
MSRETTFGRDLHAVHDRAELGAVFTWLCRGRWRRTCSARAMSASTIGIKLRYDDFRIATRDQTGGEPRRTRAASASWRASASSACLWIARLRLLGVRVGSLVRLDGQPAAPDQVSNHDLPLFQQAPAAPEK